MNEFRKCKTRISIFKQNERKNTQKLDYYPLVGDPCYRYSRLTREKFLKNKACAFLMIKAEKYIREEICKKL